MKILVAYASKSGTTKKAAELLAQKAGADIVDLAKETPEALDYDVIAVGGPIRAGRLHRDVARFIRSHHDILAQMRYAFFTCNMSGDDPKMFQKVFGDLLDGAIACVSLGSEIHLDSAKGFDKFVFKIAQKNTDEGKFPQPEINVPAIDALAVTLKQ